MLATVLAACVHDYPAMTPDGEEGIDPTLVEVSTEVTLDLELLPLEIITNKAHRGITKARAGEQTDYRRRFIIEAWRDGKPAARQVTVMDNADEAGNGKITLPVHLKLYAVEYTLAVWTDYVVAGTTTDLYYNTENLQQVTCTTPYTGTNGTSAYKPKSTWCARWQNTVLSPPTCRSFWQKHSGNAMPKAATTPTPSPFPTGSISR